MAQPGLGGGRPPPSEHQHLRQHRAAATCQSQYPAGIEERLAEMQPPIPVLDRRPTDELWKVGAELSGLPATQTEHTSAAPKAHREHRKGWSAMTAPALSIGCLAVQSWVVQTSGTLLKP